MYHIHYNTLSNYKKEMCQCVICEKSSRNKNITISDEKYEIFSKYLKSELGFDRETDIREKLLCCLPCYKFFNIYCRSEAGEDARCQMDQYFYECLNKNVLLDPVSIENIDMFTLYQITEYVIHSFLDEKAILMPALYEKYKQKLIHNIETWNFKISETDPEIKKVTHDSGWLSRLLKMKIGNGLLVYKPKRKQSGNLIYRNGTDLLNALHSITVHFQQTVHKKHAEIALLSNKNSHLISEINKRSEKHKILSEAIQILRSLVKFYISDKIHSQELPNIHNFNPVDEIHQIPPILWNFLYRLCATEKEDRDWLKFAGTKCTWVQHFMENPINVTRTLPLLFISSCIFNTHNS